MPRLKRPAHERFALAYVQTSNAAEAYRQAFPACEPTESARRCGSRMLTRADVNKRVEEVRDMVARKHDVTVDSLVEELDAAQGLASRLDQPSAMVQAIVAKARVTGNLVDRKEVGKPRSFESLATAAEVLQAVRRELGDKAADDLASALGVTATAAPGVAAPGSETVN